MDGMIGFWPLNQNYQGQDLINGTSNITLNGVLFDVVATPWAAPAVEFLGNSSSWGYTASSPHLVLMKSFSWMANVYVQTIIDAYMFVYFGSNYEFGPEMWLAHGKLHVKISYPVCPQQSFTYSTALTLNQWHTVAVSFDWVSQKMSMWVDGQLEQKQWPACSDDLRCPPIINIGKWYVVIVL